MWRGNWKALVGRWHRIIHTDDRENRLTSLHVPLPDGGVAFDTNDASEDDEIELVRERGERRFRAIVENGRDAISLIAADGTTLYVSPAVERISGHAPSDLVGNDFFANVHPDDREPVSSAFASLRATHSVDHTFVYRARHRDGSYLWLEATGRNLIADPCVGAIVTTLRNVTGSRELAEERPHAAEAQRSQERLRVLAKATQAFSEASLAPARLFDAVVREIAEALQCACALGLVTDDGAHFTTAHAHAPDPDLLSTFRAHLAAGGPRRIDAHPGMRHVFETSTPFFMPHIEASTGELEGRAAPDVLQFARGMHVKSALVVPLRLRGRVIGALGLSRHGEQASAFDEQDLALVQSLAEHAALALATAHLLEEAERQLAERERMAARLRLLTEASHEFSDATGDYDRLLVVVARRLADLLGDLCAIRAVSEDGTMLETGAAHHREPEMVAWARELLTTHPQRVGEGATGRVAASGQALLISRISAADFAASTSPQYREILERLSVGSVIIVPLVCRGKTVGVASLLRSGPDNRYTEADLHLVQSVADHAALAIANARSYAAERAARAAAVNANEAARESESANRFLFEGSPIPLLVFDAETLDLLAVNDAALRLYGYAHGELLLMKISDLRIDTGDLAGATLAAPGEPESGGTACHRRKDGSRFFAEYASRAFVFGGRDARIAVITDVTARRDAEEMRALLAAVVQSSNDAIVSKGLDGPITSWNGAAERLFGYSAAEAIGQPLSLIVPPDRLDEVRALLDRVASGERVDHLETVRRRKDGTDVVVSASLAPILDVSGKVVGSSVTVRDLTSQRKAEEALRSTEEQLRHAQKMEAVGRLAGGIAHDFNNVLSVILSYGEMILGSAKPGDPTRSDVEEICKAALRAADLTRQLLTFSRKQIVAPKVLDLNVVLVGMDKMVRRILGEDIALISVPAQELGRVLADPSNIEQVIMNLVVNARDAMPTGGKLTIETGNVDLDGEYAREHLGATPGPHVMLAVSDTGVGMDSATQARAFEPFFTTKEAGKGTGLGLSTVFGIAQQSGGCVWVYSEPGNGTTFKVYLPRIDAEADLAGQSSPPVDLRGSETILLVEDQEQVRVVARSILERNGYRVIVAHDAADALVLCEKHPGTIHLMLTDVVMPEMSGAELAKRLAVPRPEMKVLCMSGYTDDCIVRHGVLESGMAFLQKPFTSESLARRLREVLDASPGGPR